MFAVSKKCLAQYKFKFQFCLMFKCADHYVFEVQTVLTLSADVKVYFKNNIVDVIFSNICLERDVRCSAKRLFLGI